MIHRYRQLSAVVLTAACIFAVTACGSSSSHTSTPAASAPGGGARSVGLSLTTSQRSCLKKHGVTLPTGGFGGRSGRRFAGGKGATPPQNAKFPAGARHRGQGGTPPGGRGGFGHSSAQTAALKACGVSFGSRSYGGPGGPGTTNGG